MLQDFRYALRLLIKDRSFTVTALLTLAICIGANTAMFSVVRSVLLKPLPFHDSDRIALLYNSYPGAGAPRVGAAVPDYYDRMAAVPGLDQQALFRRDGMTLGDESGVERLYSLRATPSFYQIMGVHPSPGRSFTEDDAQEGKANKVLISYGLWQRKFGGANSAVGKTIRLNGNAFEVVGVMPRAFTFLQNDTDLYLPAAFGPNDKSDERRHSNNWQMIGHLRPGASLTLVKQQVDALNLNNDSRFPKFKQILRDAHFQTVVVGLQDDVVRDVKKQLYLLWGAVLFVLLLGCVNLANLVIVRSSGRTREMATRHAIGGDIGRLARQLLTETIFLALVGGGLGILIGWWGLRSLSTLNLADLPRGYEIGLDPVSVAVILALTLVVGLILGLAPALRLRRMNLNVELREETRGGTAGRRATLVRGALAALQIGIALMLLVGAGLLVASFRSVMHLDFGFNPDRVMTAAVNLPGSSYGKPELVVGFEQRSLAAIRALPGVEAAGGTTLVPFSGNVSNNVILGEGHVMKPGESLLAPMSAIVTSGYFEALGVKLAGGRFFDARDTQNATSTAIIDDRLATFFWPGQDAVGRRLFQPQDPSDISKITKDTKFITVVGVIKEMQLLDPRADYTPVGVVYYPFEQATPGGLTFTVRTRDAAAPIVNDIRRVVAGIDPQLPVFRPRTMNEWIDLALIGRRMPMLIAIAFGVVALFLAAIGVYGVLAYNVSQRRRDLGVRMALGGTSGDVFKLILGYGMRIVGIGLPLGLLLSLGLGQLMRTSLFNVTPLDPVVLVGMSAILTVVAMVASLIPAWRASRINPIVVLSR